MPNMKKLNKDNYIGCLLGGAVGDALGAPTEFMTLEQIIHQFGAHGVSEYVEFNDKIGRFTDDTQMTLFTAEGLLRSINRASMRGIWGAYLQIVHHSYIRWLHTQQGQFGSLPGDNPLLRSWLLNQELLYQRRSPGNTCLNALQSGKAGTIHHPINNSKGCGGIMRIAPVGLLFQNPEEAFKIAAELAAITHGHPDGYLPAGALASLISYFHQDISLENSLLETLRILKKWKQHEETAGVIYRAIDLSRKQPPAFSQIERLGQGWTGEEALSISLYCALCYPNDFEKAVVLAVNHSGDTDSTGSITGNLLGCLLGQNSIPKRWQENLELSSLVAEIAEDLYIENKGDSFIRDENWDKKYPGC